MQGRLSLAGWQWLFLVEALPAVILGAVFLFYLPDGPAQAKWLTEPERSALVARTQLPVTQQHSHSIGPVLRDSRVWLLGLFMFFMIGGAYAFNFSAPAVLVKVTGLSVTHVGFITAAAALLGAFAMIANGKLSDRRRAPFAHIIPGCLMMSVGFIAFGLSTTPVISVIGLFLLSMGLYSMQGPLWSIATSYFSGRCAAAAIAAMNTIGILGGFIGPYWMGYARDLTGNYQRGLTTMSVPMLVAACIILYLRVKSRRQSILKFEPIASFFISRRAIPFSTPSSVQWRQHAGPECLGDRDSHGIGRAQSAAQGHTHVKAPSCPASATPSAPVFPVQRLSRSRK